MQLKRQRKASDRRFVDQPRCWRHFVQRFTVVTCMSCETDVEGTGFSTADKLIMKKVYTQNKKKLINEVYRQELTSVHIM